MQKLSRLTAPLVAVAVLVLIVQRPHGRLRGADDQAIPTAPFEEQPAASETLSGTGVQSEPRGTGESVDALRLIRNARERLFGYSSVRANLREYVALGDRRFEANGTYITGQLNPSPQLRLEYEVRVGNTVGTLLEICDGQILRTQRTIQRVDPAAAADPAVGKPEISVTRRDVRKILDAVYKHGATPETIVQAELGIGGLPALLTSIERAMLFQDPTEEQLAGRPCHVLKATWRPDYLASLEQQFQYFGRNVQTYLPDHVKIYLDAETLFPMRISYWPAETAESTGREALLTLELTDVRVNEPVSPLLFEFVPTGVDESDVTGQYIEAIQGAAAQRTAPPSTEAPQ